MVWIFEIGRRTQRSSLLPSDVEQEQEEQEQEQEEKMPICWPRPFFQNRAVVKIPIFWPWPSFQDKGRGKNIILLGLVLRWGLCPSNGGYGFSSPLIYFQNKNILVRAQSGVPNLKCQFLVLQLPCLQSKFKQKFRNTYT